MPVLKYSSQISLPNSVFLNLVSEISFSRTANKNLSSLGPASASYSNAPNGTKLRLSSGLIADAEEPSMIFLIASCCFCVSGSTKLIILAPDRFGVPPPPSIFLVPVRVIEGAATSPKLRLSRTEYSPFISR